MQNIAVLSLHPTRDAEAAAFAHQHDIACIRPEAQANAPYAHLLVYTADKIGLLTKGDKHLFALDFLSASFRHRCQQSGLRKEFIARAMGVSPQENPWIVDATAGLGRDGYLLARLGFQVTLLERSPIIHCLLQDALLRASTDPQHAVYTSRLNLIATDATHWLKQLPSDKRPRVIYLDPMFPKRQKAAAVKKDMSLLQAIVGVDESFEDLFELSLACATHRVVIKRPRLAAYVMERKPHFHLMGKSSRFDIYMV